MAERTAGDAVYGQPERQVLRHWPWLVLCTIGLAAFGLLATVAGYRLTRVSSVTGYLVSGAFTAGLAALAAYTVASLRTRTVLDRNGLTSVAAFGRATVPWSRVDRLDVTHSLPGWAVRAWSPGGDPVVVFMCHDTHGRRPKSARTFERPPPEAPVALHRGFSRIERYWHASSASSAQ